ncbi:ABC transporter substrate-binding protein [Jiangella mangrovi]|uniref:Multiple sugar transport system substrate-binding protein n=1 Tax=Jiangella mangrovi TaxID=1524084 RepID=A0A7W9GRP6_9ACTN|nr:sugar ABC transporter substrate-binding protein [Jiangella mangrovi]MBB5788573.1 multiple sugar transport system substrate-binding protein [Jiangella mangrovi]
MTRTTRLLVLCTAGVMAAGLTACSGPDSGDGTTGGATTLRLGAYAASGSDFEKQLEEHVAAFEEETGVQVELEVAPYAEFFQRLSTQVAGGDAPDVWLSDGVFVPQYAARGALADLTDRVDEELEAATLGLDLVRDPDGRLYGFPQGAQTPALYYNKAMFDEAGVEYPTEDWTYDDLAAAAKELTKDTNGDGQADQWGFRAFSSGFTESWWVISRAFGSEVVTDGNSTVAVDDDATKAALEWMDDAIYGSAFAPDPTMTEALGGPHNLFPQGKVAMIFGIYARSNPANAAGIDFDVAPLPTGPGGSRGEVGIVNSWVVNAEADDEQADAAWEWIQWYSSADVQVQLLQGNEAIPIDAGLAASPEFLEKDGNPANREVFVDALAEASDLGVNPVWEEYTTAINEEFTRILTHEVSVDDGVRAAQERAQEAIDRFDAAG